MSFKFMKLVVDWDGVKYNNRLELGDESDTPVDLRFKVPGYIENVHTVFFQNYSSETNVPRIYGDATNLVFYDNHDATNRDGVKLADLVGGMGESLWESSTDNETYLTTSEPVNLKGQPLRGSNISGGGLLLVANSVDVGKIYCQDMLDVQKNDIVNVNEFCGRDDADLVFYGATQAQNGTDEFMRWAWDGQKLVMNNTLSMGGHDITGTSVIKAEHLAGVEFRPYDYTASGDELLNIADGGFAFVANANANMDGNDLSYVKAINGTTTIPLHLNFCGNDPATHEIWRDGDDLKFKDVHTGTKTLSQLAAGGGSSTFIGLSDTPPNYTDATGKFVKVSDANTLEFVAGSGSFICTDLNSCHVTDLTDVSSAGSGSIITDVERTKLNGINTSDFLLIDGSNHMTGALNFTNGSYVGKIELDASGNLMLFRGINTSTEAMRFASEENIMYANLNMSGAKITGIGAGTAASHDAARMFDLDSYMLTATYVSGDGIFDIPVGGTGISTFAQGDILYASDVSTLAALGKGTATQVLTMNTAGTLPEWATGSSSSAFIGLSDTPPDYTGAAGKYVRVNSVPDGLEFVAGSGGGVTDHALLTNLDYAHAGHTGFAPTSHAHAWSDITSGVPAYCTRWPSWTEVSSKPSLLYTDGSNHMTGDLNFWNGSYRGAIDLDGSGNLIFSRGLNSPTTAMMFASEENIMYANINMGGNAIDDAGVIKANATTGIDCCYSGGTTMLYIATSSYAFVANANANMNTHNIINVGGITMSGPTNLSGYTVTGIGALQANDVYGVSYRCSDGTGVLGIGMLGTAFIAAADASMGGHDLIDINTLKGCPTNDLSFWDHNAGTKTLSQLAAGGGSSTFIGLSDTPPDYTGAAGKYVRVNSVPDGLEFVAGSGGGVTDHALLTNLDYAHAGHTGFAPTSHAHAWSDITSGVPAYCTRWPSWTEVSSKPSLLYTDGSNHMTGDLNFWNGSYRGAIDLDGSGNLIFSRGLNSPTTAMMFASEENIMYANINMGGNAIDDAGVIKANATTGIDCCYSGGTTMLYIATSSYAFVANANANMNTHNIINVGGITMSGPTNLSGYTVTGIGALQANDVYGVSYRCSDGTGVLGIGMLGTAFIAAADASMGGHDLIDINTLKGCPTNDLSFWDHNAGTKTLSQLAAGGGSSTFIGLSDTPPDYTGAAGKYVRVNSVPDGLEFVAGSGGGVTDHGALTGLGDDDHSQYLLASGSRYLNGSLSFDTSLSSAIINFDSNNDYLSYDCTNDLYEFKIGGTTRLSVGLENIIAYENLNLSGYTAFNVAEIKGNTTTSLEVDLRGDDNHRIYYTGATDNKMRYRTYSHHVFDVNGVVQMMIQNDGVHMQSGKKIKSDSGNLAFEVPSGSYVTFTAV